MVFSEEILVGKLLVNMRIIGGKFKGKNIEFLRTNKTRPLKDSVKENIFNIIAHSKFVDIRLNGSSVLDAYSGVGSFGLECLSRGANFVTFVERDIDAMSTLEKNISNLKIKNQSKLINGPIENFCHNINSRFDIFFFDPPFADKSFIENVKILKREKNFKKKNLVIIHREKSSKDNFDKVLKVFIVRNYGRSKLIFAQFI